MRKLAWSRNAATAGALFVAGLLLRMYFVRYRPFVAGDSVLYLDISQSWLESHTYGLSTNTVPRPTLIRLPGYPMVLAALQLLFPGAAHTVNGTGVYALVMRLQIAADLGTCGLIGILARRHFGKRAGLAALTMAALCPFLANYTAVPLTEAFVLFTIALAFFAADSWRRKPTLRWLLATAFALGASLLLRPDQGLLAAAVLPLFLRWPNNADAITGPAADARPPNEDATTASVLRTRQSAAMRWRSGPMLLCAALAALPLVPWTVRNANTFHVFQPLAPKSATDPGEPIPRGFPRWYRTYAVDFSSTEDAYWNYPENPVDPRDLPSRAFDSPAQRAQTTALLQKAAKARRLDPGIEAGFGRLAAERIHSSPLRYYVVLPAGRLLNMLLHPRTEMLPIDERWWRYSLHPGQTLFALLYAALNAAYLVLACFGLRRAWCITPALTASMLTFILLRCALLLTLDNAEQRYTMEFLPLCFFFASAFFARRNQGAR